MEARRRCDGGLNQYKSKIEYGSIWLWYIARGLAALALKCNLR